MEKRKQFSWIEDCEGLNIYQIVQMLDYNSPEYVSNAIELLEYDPFCISMIKQTDELCMYAVRKIGEVLKFVINKTREICMEAIINSPSAILYVPVDSEFYDEMASLATRLDPNAIQYINYGKQNTDMAIYAVAHNPKNVKYLAPDIRNDECIIKIASSDPSIFFKQYNGVYADYRTEHEEYIDKLILHEDGRNIKYYKDIDIDIAKLAIQGSNILSILYFLPTDIREKVVPEIIDKIKSTLTFDIKNIKEENP